MAEQEQTHGQKLVGLSFNPANDDKVAECKQGFADRIDQLEAFAPVDEDGQEFVKDAIKAIVAAQMAAVKALTWGLGK